MSRDRLVPPSFSSISDRFGTPVASITLTGVVLLALIAFVPILEIAKLASAFQIMVFALINAAVLAFREGSTEYEPEFTSPLYPWIQVFGIVTGLLLLTQMGTIALVGAVVIVVGSVLWYLVYVRQRVDREGVAMDVVRKHVSRRALTAVDPVPTGSFEQERRSTERVEESEPHQHRHEVLVALTKDLDEARERSLVALAADVVRPHRGRVIVARFEEVPDQVPLTEDVAVQSSSDMSFEARMNDLETELGVEIEADEIVSHDTKHAIVNLAADRQVETILAEHEPLRLRSRLFGDPIDWMVRHAPCDVLLVDNLGYERPEEIAISSGGTPYSPLTISVAEAIAVANRGSVSLWYSDRDSGTVQSGTLSEYESGLSEILSVPVRKESIRPDGGQLPAPDLLVRRGAGLRIRDALFDERPTFPNPGCTTVTVHARESRQPGALRRLAERVVL